MSVKEFVKFKLNKGLEGGVEGYFVAQPRYEPLTKVRIGPPKWNKEQKNMTYIDDIQKRSKEIPSSTKYSRIDDWAKSCSSRQIIAKDKKLSYIDEIKKQKKLIPGPGTYKTLIFQRIQGYAPS